ncbi:ATP-dependent Lon protease [Oikeobacillus pervagus]|uniref:ATP-dependent Lon protease n=1 Tax=Oikeobacillus pervagus TaxID=1325931 RepID=A0AAJ1T0I0_9BACI|nr:hypothetical protein [Oikeobacillus pervagus]MDQ0213654.1 ATP-dependent Lon protease [Oikeobacillus pervagus]
MIKRQEILFSLKQLEKSVDHLEKNLKKKVNSEIQKSISNFQDRKYLLHQKLTHMEEQLKSLNKTPATLQKLELQYKSL